MQRIRLAQKHKDILAELCARRVTVHGDGAKFVRQGRGSGIIPLALRRLAVYNAYTWGRWHFIEITDPWNAQSQMRKALRRGGASTEDGGLSTGDTEDTERGWRG